MWLSFTKNYISTQDWQTRSPTSLSIITLAQNSCSDAAVVSMLPEPLFAESYSTCIAQPQSHGCRAGHMMEQTPVWSWPQLSFSPLTVMFNVGVTALEKAWKMNECMHAWGWWTYWVGYEMGATNAFLKSRLVFFFIEKIFKYDTFSKNKTFFCR